MHTHMHTCTRTHIHTHSHTHTQSHTHAHTHAHTLSHTHTHSQIWTRRVAARGWAPSRPSTEWVPRTLSLHLQTVDPRPGAAGEGMSGRGALSQPSLDRGGQKAQSRLPLLKPQAPPPPPPTALMCPVQAHLPLGTRDNASDPGWGGAWWRRPQRVGRGQPPSRDVPWEDPGGAQGALHYPPGAPPPGPSSCACSRHHLHPRASLPTPRPSYRVGTRFPSSARRFQLGPAEGTLLPASRGFEGRMYTCTLMHTHTQAPAAHPPLHPGPSPLLCQPSRRTQRC